MPRMEIARALSFDVPSSSIIPTEADEDVEIKEHLVDPYAKIEQEVEPFNQSFEPFVGMEFDSIDLGYKFYNFYGFKTGFGIRKAQNYHSNTGEKKVISQRYVCSKEGLSKRQKHESVEVGKSANVKTPEKAISFVRTGCKASMSISLQPNGRWLVTTFNKEHNHDLVPSPSKKKYFKSHMHIREDQKECIRILHNKNVPPTKIFEAIVEKEGGRQNILFSKKLLNNEIAKEDRKLVGVDVKIEKDTMDEIEKDVLYEVKTIPDPTNPDWKTMAFQVCVNKAINEVSCNCQGFEFEDLLCSHSLKVMQNLGMHLDSRYVLLRWTKEANQGVKRYSDDARSVEVLRSDADRYDCLRMKAMKIVKKFCKPFEVYNIASTKLDVCYNEIDELTKNIRDDVLAEHSSAATNKSPHVSGQVLKEVVYQDPPQSQCKGKRRPKRFKHPVEKKMRTCKICKEKAGHNSRTCPQL